MPDIDTPLTLRAGITLPNRLVKAAMSEHLATNSGAPSDRLIELSRVMAKSGVALMISGNVMVDGSALEARRNVVIEDETNIEVVRRWASVSRDTGGRFMLQLSHPGRQTFRGLAVAGRRQDVVAPSAIPLQVGGGRMFKTPRELRDDEIHAIIRRFARAASVAAAAGFDGVQIHGAHGYLPSQFLSPLTNRRRDRWGGVLENRMRFLLEIIGAVRDATPTPFLVAVKLNSSDFQQGGFTSDDAAAVAQALAAEGIDFLEISGGTYERAAMVDGARPKRASTRIREAYFLDFARQLRAELSIPLMLTGGFRSREGMREALHDGAVDLIGLARPLAHEPDLPQQLLAGAATESAVKPHTIGHKVLDGLLDGAWHQQQLARLGRGRAVAAGRSAAAALAVLLATSVRDSLSATLSSRRSRGEIRG